MSEELVFSPTTDHIKLDLFPATVTRGVFDDVNAQILFTETRVIITNDYIYVIATGPLGPYFALQEEFIELKPVKGKGFEVSGANYDYTLTTAGNCGCGSRLRGLRILPGVGRMTTLY